MFVALLGALLIGTPSDTTKPVKFTTDLGLVSTSGNTNLTTLNVAEHLGFVSHGWEADQRFSVIYGKSDGEVTTSLWVGSLRGERDVSEHVGIFILGGYERNTFAGIRARYAPQVGVNLKLLAGERDKLRAELGAGYTWQWAVPPGDDREFAGGRGALFYEHLLGEKTRFTQMIEFLPDFKTSEDLRINSETAIAAPITAGIALRAGYIVRYDGLPEAGRKGTDRILTTGVQLSF